MATREDLTNDIIKATEDQQRLMGKRKFLLGSKSNDEQLTAFRITTQIMKYEDFIQDTEKQLRTMD